VSELTWLSALTRLAGVRAAPDTSARRIIRGAVARDASENLSRRDEQIAVLPERTSLD
jgi:hypothetical protein